MSAIETAVKALEAANLRFMAMGNSTIDNGLPTKEELVCMCAESATRCQEALKKIKDESMVVRNDLVVNLADKVSAHHTAMMERFLEGFLSAEVVKQHANDPMKAAILISEITRTHELCMDYDHDNGVARYWLRAKDAP